MTKKGKTTYTREQVYEQTLKYFNGDTLAANVWIDKYCLKDDAGYYELTPDDMHRRLAKEFARIEQKYENPMSEEFIYGLFKDFKYIIPQGSPMYGIGNPLAVSLSNCYVIGNQPEADSYGGIFKLDQEQAQLMKRRGGVGQDLSFIRPRGAKVNNSAMSSTGVVPYMERFSNTTREVAQEGRRGALLLSINVLHPDVMDFIDSKVDTSKITGANISVKLTDSFMEAANNEADILLRYPTDLDVSGLSVDDFNQEELVKVDGGYVKRISAWKIFSSLYTNAWKSGEPGCLMWSKVLSESTAKGYGDKWKPISTNPCGEIVLPPYDSCRLIAINLFSYILNPYSPDAKVLVEQLFSDVVVAQRIMDDMIDLEIEKLDQIISKIESDIEPNDIKYVELSLWKKIKNMAEEGRRTGLGYTGLGDMIAAIGLTYGTEKATNFADDVQKLFSAASYTSSVNLAKERGAFKDWSYAADMESDFIRRMFNENPVISENTKDVYAEYGRRNIANLTIAPTGSVSILTQTTSGVEPLFTPFYFRSKKTSDKSKMSYTDEVGDMWEEFAVLHKPFVQWFSVHNNKDMGEAQNILMGLSRDELNEIFEQSPYFKATANDVDYVEKVRMQGLLQLGVDHSISVTVNMPQDVDVETVRDVYKMAWESGCKGVTVYRDGSRLGVLNSEKKVAEAEKFEYISAHKRPRVVDHDVYFRTAYGVEYIIMVGIVEGKPYEIMAMPYDKDIGLPKSVTKGKLTKDKSRNYRFESDKGHVIENIIEHMVESEQVQTRDYSTMLRHRVDPMYIIDSIESYATISSFQKNVAKILRLYVDNTDGGECPECQGKIAYVEGCLKCLECGYSKCG